MEINIESIDWKKFLMQRRENMNSQTINVLNISIYQNWQSFPSTMTSIYGNWAWFSHFGVFGMVSQKLFADVMKKKIKKFPITKRIDDESQTVVFKRENVVRTRTKKEVYHVYWTVISTFWSMLKLFSSKAHTHVTIKCIIPSINFLLNVLNEIFFAKKKTMFTFVLIHTQRTHAHHGFNKHKSATSQPLSNWDDQLHILLSRFLAQRQLNIININVDLLLYSDCELISV